MKRRTAELLVFVFGPSLFGVLVAVAAVTFFMGYCANRASSARMGCEHHEDADPLATLRADLATYRESHR